MDWAVTRYGLGGNPRYATADCHSVTHHVIRAWGTTAGALPGLRSEVVGLDSDDGLVTAWWDEDLQDGVHVPTNRGLVPVAVAAVAAAVRDGMCGLGSPQHGPGSG